VHGIGEHSGRYDHVGERLTSAGYALVALDLRGHGKSAGRRGDARFEPILRDIDELLEEERARHAVPLFLYGHSLGGLLVLHYALARKPALSGVIASGAGLHTALREQRLKVALARVLGGLVPFVTLPTGLDHTQLSRDPEVLRAYVADPLVHERASLGFGKDALDAIDQVLAHAGEIALPLLLVHGAADQLNYPSGSEEVASKLGRGCTLRLYEGGLHEPHNDLDRERVLGEIVAWLDSQL
jgi:acylglycerol lipase